MSTNPTSFTTRQNLHSGVCNGIAKATLLVLPLALFAISLSGCNLGAQHNNVTGRRAFEMGQYSVAINEFQKALSKNPNNADALYNLGASLYSQAKQTKNQQVLNQAEQLYRQAIAKNDQHVDAHRGLAGLLIETDREKYAFDLINTWKTRYPASTEPIVELARLYQEYGDNRRATDLLADALKIDSNNVRVLKAMGHVREIQGQTHLALDNYIRVIQLDNQQTEVAAKVASLQNQLARLPVPNNGIGAANQQNAVPSRYGAVAPYLR
ncbi:MAG: tetratricopeptide repeat protein [Mariniblastus sp.]